MNKKALIIFCFILILLILFNFNKVHYINNDIKIKDLKIQREQLTKDTIIVETISAKNYTVIGIGGYTEEKPYIDIFFGKNMIELEYE